MKLEKIYSNSLVGTTYLFLQSPALALAIWSFKLNKTLFSETLATDSNNNNIEKNNVTNFGRGITKHQTNGGILGAGVCRLGKFAGWLIIIQTLLTNILLYSVNIKKNKKYKNTILGVIITNSILLTILVFISLFMNPQLFVRTIPFYLLQVGTILYLISIYYLIQRIEESNIEESNIEESNIEESNIE